MGSVSCSCSWVVVVVLSCVVALVSVDYGFVFVETRDDQKMATGPSRDPNAYLFVLQFLFLNSLIFSFRTCRHCCNVKRSKGERKKENHEEGEKSWNNCRKKKLRLVYAEATQTQQARTHTHTPVRNRRFKVYGYDALL